MKQYVVSYFGGIRPETEEAQRQNLADYQAWLESLGDAAVKPMVPYRHTRTIHPDGSVTEGSASTMTGHTVIQATSLEAAIALAVTCPFLTIEGTLEVAELGVV